MFCTIIQNRNDNSNRRYIQITLCKLLMHCLPSPHAVTGRHQRNYCLVKIFEPDLIYFILHQVTEQTKELNCEDQESIFRLDISLSRQTRNGFILLGSFLPSLVAAVI